MIGTRVWRRDGSSAPWELGAWPDPGFAWPATYYRMEWGGASAVRLLGTEEMDGVASEVVGFVLPKLPAWFELWVGEKDALVRRMVMRAQGHLMVDSYRDFNTPVAVVPPG